MLHINGPNKASRSPTANAGAGEHWDDPGTPAAVTPCVSTGAARHASAGVVVGLLLTCTATNAVRRKCRSVRTPFGQSGSFLGLELIPSKWRCPVPPMLRDTPEGA